MGTWAAWSPPTCSQDGGVLRKWGAYSEVSRRLRSQTWDSWQLAQSRQRKGLGKTPGCGDPHVMEGDPRPCQGEEGPWLTLITSVSFLGRVHMWVYSPHTHAHTLTPCPLTCTVTNSCPHIHTHMQSPPHPPHTVTSPTHTLTHTLPHSHAVTLKHTPMHLHTQSSTQHIHVHSRPSSHTFALTLDKVLF